MSMPWNLIKVTLHSSSHYPSDAMSMPWNVVKVTLPNECNVHAMECGQGGNIRGDITHVMQCHFVSRWFLWHPSRELLFTLMTTQQPSLDQWNHSMCTLHVVKTITPRLLLKAIGKISRYHRYLYFRCNSMDDIQKVKYIHFCNVDGRFSSLSAFVRNSLRKDTPGQKRFF
jgi:hypothetical protein